MFFFLKRSKEDELLSNFRRMHLVGYKLFFTQMFLLNKRIVTYLMTHKGFFFALRLVIPIICLIIITLTSNYSLRRHKLFSHQIHKTSSGDTRLVYNVGPSRRSGLFNIVDRCPNVKPVYALDIDGEFRRLSKGYLNQDTVGLEMTDNYTRIYHSLDPRATSKSINLFSNIYMSMFMPYLNSTIRTSYESMPKPQTGKFKEVKSMLLCLKFTSWLTFLSIIPLSPLILLCIVERTCGIRENHMMAGCTPEVHWGARLLAHMTAFVIIILIPIIFIVHSLDYDETFTQTWFLFAVIILLFVFGLAFHTSLYLMSFFFDENVAIGEIFIASLFFGVTLPVFLSILDNIWKESLYFGVPYVLLVVMGRISPQFALGVGLARLTLTARLNAFCTLNRDQCPDLQFGDEGFDAEVCCQSDISNPFPYFVSYESGLFDLINLIIQFIVFSTLVILLEYKIPQNIYEKFAFARYKEPAQAFDVQNVREEAAYVRTAVRNKSYEDNVLLVQNVHKDFKTRKSIRKSKIIAKQDGVRGISYATKLGECLAIIGPHSAGKSVLLNMLAGNTTMTRGDACIDGFYLRRNRMKYIHNISLSSSTGGLDNFMTGAQNLVFIAKLKGYPDDLAMFFAYKALRCMGLLTVDPLVSNYSSGCLRRLSLCSALVLGPTVAFLDEPMKEVDSSSKPLVANALQRLKGLPASVIVAESSVDWSLLEPVFNRMAIMTKGQFATIGPTHEILERIARGYSARIKLRMVTAYRKDKSVDDDEFDDDDLGDEESSVSDMDVGPSASILEPSKGVHSEKSVMFATTLDDFKRDFLKAFSTSRLCREHLSMLFFIIEDDYQTERYSDMFRKLQELKEKYDYLVEDYYLSSVTVEDVFYRFQYERAEGGSILEGRRFSSTTSLKGFNLS